MLKILEDERGFFRILSGIDEIIYGLCGLGLLAYGCFLIGSWIHASGSTFAIAGFYAVIASSIGQLLRDFVRREMGLISRIVLGAWATCVGIVLLIEIFA